MADHHNEHNDNVSSDAGFSSTYGSDIDERLPAYESPEEPQEAAAFIVGWTSVRRSQAPTNESDNCVVCGVRPKHAPYPTCGLTCAAKLRDRAGSTGSPSHSGGSNNSGSSGGGGGLPSMCVVCGVRESYSKGGRKYATCGLTCGAKYKANGGPNDTGGASPDKMKIAEDIEISGVLNNLNLGRHSGSTGSSTSTPSSVPTGNPGMCVVCGIRPSYSKGGKRYPTCSFTCADTLRASKGSQRPIVSSQESSSKAMCVVCGVRECHSNGKIVFPTCGITCAEKLANGGGPQNMCEYCHRRPRLQNHLHCDASCKDKARTACLICRCHPMNGKYHFCGKTCRDIATKTLLVQVPPDHVTFEMVQNKFQNAWRAPEPCPQISRIYKVAESKTFLQPYDAYRSVKGNEVFRYHGTSRQCRLGSNGQLRLCNSNTCAACSILRTSFKVSLANRGGAFGQGIYTSSAANKSATYSGFPSDPERIMFLNKVILGVPYNVSAFTEVMSCPIGYDSVIFDRQNGSLNETVVYRDDAVRPVFLIVFR